MRQFQKSKKLIKYTQNSSPHLHHVAASLLACRIFYKNTASLLSAAAPPSHKTYWVLREPYCALRRFSLRDFFTITFNIRLICSLVNALTTLHCRYHFFASSPSAYFIFSKIRLRFYRLPLLHPTKPIGFCGNPIAPCGALSYTIFKHYSKKCDTQNHAPHFSIHCSYYLIRYIIVIYLKSLSSRFKPFSIYPSRLPLILSAFAIASATDGFSAIISFKLNSSFERKNSTQVNECCFD